MQQGCRAQKRQLYRGPIPPYPLPARRQKGHRRRRCFNPHRHLPHAQERHLLSGLGPRPLRSSCQNHEDQAFSSPDFRTSAMPSKSRPWRHNRILFLVSKNRRCSTGASRRFSYLANCAARRSMALVLFELPGRCTSVPAASARAGGLYVKRAGPSGLYAAVDRAGVVRQKSADPSDEIEDLGRVSDALLRAMTLQLGTFVRAKGQTETGALGASTLMATTSQPRSLLSMARLVTWRVSPRPTGARATVRGFRASLRPASRLTGFFSCTQSRRNTSRRIILVRRSSQG